MTSFLVFNISSGVGYNIENDWSWHFYFLMACFQFLYTLVFLYQIDFIITLYESWISFVYSTFEFLLASFWIYNLFKKLRIILAIIIFINICLFFYLVIEILIIVFPFIVSLYSFIFFFCFWIILKNIRKISFRILYIIRWLMMFIQVLYKYLCHKYSKYSKYSIAHTIYR